MRSNALCNRGSNVVIGQLEIRIHVQVQAWSSTEYTSYQVVKKKAVTVRCDQRASFYSVEQAYQPVQHCLDQWKRQYCTISVLHQSSAVRNCPKLEGSRSTCV